MLLPNHPNSPPKKRPFGFLTCRRTKAAKRSAVVAMLAMVLTGNTAPFMTPVQPAVVQAQGIDPNEVGFVLTDGDIRFIIKQIQIAQEHAAGNPLFGPGELQVNDPRVPFGLRTVDGSLNHLVPGQERWGAADEIFPRLAPAAYRTAQGSTYLQKRGNVTDPQPRMISNLIADQTVRNPAAIAVSGTEEGDPLGTLPILNAAPDVGLSAPFNSMFTFFGQFFDHGLDLVTKGRAGFVVVPLPTDDPLIAGDNGILGDEDDLPLDRRFMVLTRGTNLPGPDGISGDDPATPQDESADDIREQTNTTTPFVDQNQTYTSHPSHQVFLRDYDVTPAGPVPNGRLIDGADPLGDPLVSVGNIGSWREVKAQAANELGIRLVDLDAFNVPLLETDPYGHFKPGPARGMPQFKLQGGGLLEAGGVVGGTPIPANALRTGHGFLDDIAHAANPIGPNGVILAADADGLVGNPQAPGQYDDELLGAHFVTGDGRGNENIALTAVHAVFHAEHNRLREYIHAFINAPVNPATGRNVNGLTQADINQWHGVHAGSGWAYGERLFQAARFVTEMQYQHLVFEEFARKISPTINAFIGDGINMHSDFNPAIFAEFAHQTYRLGHSMLGEAIGRMQPDGTAFDIPLLDGFLNPLEFNNGGPGVGRVSAADAAGAIFQGGIAQVGQEIDEFVTEAVRNRLLGLPLDLAVLNLARGRSEGVPSLNSVRMAMYLQSGDPQLLPYTSWNDFSFNMKHRDDSLVNFIAAYANDAVLQSLTTVPARRARAEVLMGLPGFLDAAGTGVDNIDLWIGGLAERIAPFGGMLGTTFNAVFEKQLEGLQDGDRFYYLERLDGLNLLGQMEGNSFAEMIKRNTSMAGSAADVFSRPGLTFNLASILRVAGQLSDDPTTEFDEANDPDLVLLPDGTVRYLGAEHVIWNGRGVADRVVSSEGDDTFTMGGGDDWFEGGAGNDFPNGGDGDDVIIDTFGEDVLKGGAGHDAIHGGSGPFDLLQGNEGNDFILGGNDDSEVFGGPGNDMIYMGAGFSESIGGSGDDWMEGTNSPASIAIGDDNNQFQNDPNGGNDILVAGPGDMDFDAEGGDDIMVGNVLPTHRFEGMLGFDWTTYRGETVSVDADMLITGATEINAPLNENRDRFDNTEGLSGSNLGDFLRGDNRDEVQLRNDGLTGVPNGHVLTAAGIARITGLSAITGAVEFAGGNIILGGGGSDTLEGRGGNDILDGDRWLDVQLSAPRPGGGTALLYNGMRQQPTNCAATPCAGLEARTLREAVFDVTNRVNPGSITYVRSIKSTNNAGDVDTAVFAGPRANYTVTATGAGANRVITVTDNVGTEGIDRIRNVEVLQFADASVPTVGIGANIVPNLTGLTAAAARLAITNAGLTVGAETTTTSPTVAVNRVAEQSPLPGVGVNALTAVSFAITLGAIVPDIHELSIEDARVGLAAGGVVAAAAVRDVNDAEIPAGFAAGTDPVAGSIVPPGSIVTILRSIGPVQTGIVPAVAGLQQGDGEEAIIAAGFTVGAITFANSQTVAEGAIISTTPGAGATPLAGSAIAIRVSLGRNGLVAAFAFDEADGLTARDSSIVARDGAIRQALRVPGRFGGALSFDGINDWVTVTDVTNSPLDLTGQMTIEAWVQPFSLGGWNTVVLKERGAGNLSYALYAHDGAPDPFGFDTPAAYLRAAPAASTTDQAVRRASPLQIGVWQHLATTYDGTTMRLYVDGVEVASKPQTGNIVQANGALRIGGNNVFVTGEFYHGLIDEVRIYNRALTATEIGVDMLRPIIQP